MKDEEIDIIEEIYRVGEMYRNSERKIAKNSYNDYINIIISQEERYNQKELSEIWDRQKEGYELPPGRLEDNIE